MQIKMIILNVPKRWNLPFFNIHDGGGCHIENQDKHYVSKGQKYLNHDYWYQSETDIFRNDLWLKIESRITNENNLSSQNRPTHTCKMASCKGARKCNNKAENLLAICIWRTINAKSLKTRMWANAQRDGRPAEHRWRPLFNAAKFGWRPLLDAVQ